MTLISLRAYNREINQMIENGQIDQAIAHCIQILNHYPKHVETYRLLGTAYLENHQFSDASDILLRLLSAVPDNPLAHIGMSVIREEDGKLDDAIWHMERANELQPANLILQDELRRLYGKRDGLEPQRIYLTRGALASMYFRGTLYHQAIAEIHAILNDDPKRLDLYLLLARTYNILGNYSSARQTCEIILKKLPFCMEANRIIVENSHRYGEFNDIDLYLSRTLELDPYYEFITPEIPELEQVPDQSINIEWLEWDSGSEKIMLQHGADIPHQYPTDITSEEPLPDWILDLDADGITEAEPIPDIDQVEIDAGEESADTTQSLSPKPEDISISDEDTKPVRVQYDRTQTSESASSDHVTSSTTQEDEWISAKDIKNAESEGNHEGSQKDVHPDNESL